MAKTYTRATKVTVKESATGKPYLAFELLSGDEIAMLDDSNIGFLLNDGVTLSEAEALAASINDKLESLYITKL